MARSCVRARSRSAIASPSAVRARIACCPASYQNRVTRAFSSYPNSRLVSAVSEVVLALLGRELVEMPADGLPERLLRAGGGLSEQLFQLGEELLDGVQIRRVGWHTAGSRPLPGSLPSRLSLCGS